MKKREILNQLIEFLQKEQAVLISAAKSAKEAATEAEAKPENQYDTRGLEQSYLAAGQGKRLESLGQDILLFKGMTLFSFDKSSPIDISALVTLESDSEGQKIYFILPTQGGIKVHYKNSEISSLSMESPLGQVLIGKSQGDSVEIKLGGQLRSYFISSVE